MRSPILSTSVRMMGKDVSGSSLQTIAGKIHANIALYNEAALKARLHDLAFECAPQRLWGASASLRG
ncbi:uncharacterized protein BDV17DRAFT_21078 [Aspergillus undulatus]|uniref:uncharacterized protein n=1 Tax=Aspergillus undulatus TaxID=1810928 RepID=UPI003CCDC619